MRKIVSVIIIVFLFAACNEPAEKKDTPKSPTTTSSNYFRITHPVRVDTLKIGDSLSFKVEARQADVTIESISVEIDGIELGTFSSTQFALPLNIEKVGLKDINVTAKMSNGQEQTKRTRQFVLSDTPAKALKFKIIKKHKHNPEHYTQGLEFHNDYLYEGTGNYGVSGLYKKEIPSTKELAAVALPNNRFGEGITILNDQIYQLTYRSREAFVYDLNTMTLKQKFTYPVNVQGWGLTHNDELLIMSTGEPILYFLEPQRFNQIAQQWICDEKKPVYSLNELELVGDVMYANIYLDNRIAKIDIKSGKVIGYLDLTELVPDKFLNDNDNVLNGIAYNAKSNTFFVTGKRWPVMYEIKMLE